MDGCTYSEKGGWRGELSGVRRGVELADEMAAVSCSMLAETAQTSRTTTMTSHAELARAGAYEGKKQED